MASNINIAYANLCISPINNNQFCYIDYDNDKFRIIQANDGGLITNGEFDLDNSVSEIKSLEYTGPRNLSIAVDDLGDELPFFTLERISGSQCKIKRWKLDTTFTQLKLQNTITLNSSSPNYFDCEAMAVEHYETSFKTSTSSGTGVVKIHNVSNIELGDILLFGPSRPDLNGAVRRYEYVEVTSVSGSDVYITTSGSIPPTYDYAGDAVPANGDPVTFWKNIYLFSDIGQNNDSTKGSLYTIDPNNGTVSGVDNSGVYSDVIAASWSRYNSYPAFVKESQLLYIDPIKYDLRISHVLNNTKANRTSLWTVYDLVLDDVDIYRLQLGRTDASDNGDLSDEIWPSLYNTVHDFTTAYTRSVDVNVNGILLNSPSIPQTTSATFTVKDQYGNGRGPGLSVDISENPNIAGSFVGSNPRTTDVNGQFSVVWNAAITLVGDADVVDVTIKAKATGGNSTVNGSTFYWGEQEFELHNRHGEDVYLDQIGADISSFTLFDQIGNVSIDKYLDTIGPFITDIYLPEQLSKFSSDLGFDQIDNDFDIDVYFDQDKEKFNELQLSQLFVSTHELFDHQDTTVVTQFTFLYDFRPPPYSEKNSIDTDIYAKIGPRQGFSLNQSTLKFKVREVSYDGDTGYVDVTSLSTITTWFPFAGNIGLEIIYVPAQPFRYNAVVYISIEVYDNAPTPNIILYDYWFKVTPDFREPYIINEIPYREEEDVLVNTDISFDVIDPGVGVDITSLELYINNRFITPTTSTISGGYHVAYNPPIDFHYGQTVEITVYAQDLSSIENRLYDTWRFYCEGSTGPWIDRNSFYPRECSRGVDRKVIGININVLGINDTGVDKTSLTMSIDDKQREAVIIPIIYRID